ncbi:hypothetical protein [Collimonas silvisoli]|uniref:hypothetical protein n=1 Tax=Collimonas silvisoli TaxID=2825884 RepID=UPI001B8D24F4|nr:hypothetical protein [Collimonas silvisoli]
MKYDVFYCKSWFRMKKVAIELWSEAIARSKHLSGDSYTALIASEVKPTCFIEFLIDKEMVGVSFLDDSLREYLSYQFQFVAPEKLFLTMATHREFIEGGTQVAGGTTYIFSQTGDLVIRRERFNPHLLEEAKSSFDPSRNYESFPAFGEYSSLIRTDR